MDREEEITRKLPGSWRAVYDPESRDYYYWNEETNEVSWDDPRKPKRAPTVTLPPGWEEVEDAETGELFYWNTVTDQTQWEPPPAPAAGAGGRGGGGGGGGGAAAKKKRGVIMAESYDVEKNKDFTLPVHAKSDNSKRVIREALQGSAGFLFASLSPDEFEQVVMAMSQVDLKPGETIIRQGDTGDNFYVVESGDFDIFVNNNKVATRGPGDSFGELALLYNCPRAASVVASSNARLWALDRVTFRYMIASTREDQLQEIVSALRQVKLLESLTDSQQKKVADAVQVVQFRPGDVIIKKGDAGDTFYMIKSGAVLCQHIGEDDQELPLDAGAYFGERALLLDEPRAADVVASSEVTCMVLDRKAFNDLLGPLRDVLDRNLGLRVVSALPLLSKLSKGEKERVADRFRTVEFAAGTVIQESGTRSDTFYVVKSGSVRLEAGGGRNQEVVTAGGHFGADALAADEPIRRRAVAVDEGTQCLMVTRAGFEEAVGPLSDIQRRSAAPVDEVAGAAGGVGGAAAAGGAAMVQRKSDVRYEDLDIMRTLGAGTFGRVKLVRHRPTNRAFALKVLQKAQVVSYGQQKNVMNERNVMMMVDHPFILKLEATYQDRNCLYMLLELVQGGELFSLLANQELGYLPSEEARFYGACVLDALHCLHDKYILYRDLKPENMLIDADGYIKLVDMGFAKVVTDRTYTLCGTPEYLAPELVLGKGHNKGVDYWALGVLIYEMLCGVSPFADDSQDQMKICRKIVKGRVTYPGFMKDRDAKDVIGKLLVSKVTNRLGCKKGGADDIKDHKWFKGLNWDAMRSKRVKAPWRPPLKDPFDTSHFDQYDEGDDVIEPYDGPNDDFEGF